MTSDNNSTNGRGKQKRGINIPNVGNAVNGAKSAFREVTGQSVTPLEYAREKQQVQNQTNYQVLRQDRAKLQQETVKADTEEKRIEFFQAQYKELGHKIDTAWVKADIAEIDHQTAIVEKEISMVNKDIREIELAIEKDNKAILEEKQELNYLKGLEELRSISLGISEKTYDNDIKQGVLDVNGSEVAQNAIPTKASIKAFLIGA
ncbi:hypothetical protein F7734_55800 [Scytonema sp. UIC 10036]|uniref:hypothetical protein n=1 Tax=Scytonema sp. UIC 10036 TaxID=2304196 RepID=UPI0012DAC5B6|nr:hypothetical protein [Scytonema sp. UIC 10036]MUH01045.1 hypothetical protein [Scytonema sp. UIC 10036]